MRRFLIAIGAWVVATPVWAQANILVPDATCDQLEPAYVAFTTEVRSHNFVQVLARTYFNNKLVRRNDGNEASYADVEEYLKAASKYDGFHFMHMMMADLGAKLKEKNCPSKDKALKFHWEAP